MGAVAAGEFLKRVGDTIIGAVGGDVVGPASATDNAVARFDTTTGKLIQNSGATIDDSGNLAVAGTVNGVNVGSLAANAVIGPASATDNAVARFDTTTGKLIQNSPVTISDSGNIAGSDAVIGPASATNGRVPSFDGTTGKLVQDSGSYPAVARILSSDYTRSSTTVADVSDLTVALVAGTYLATYNLYTEVAGTTNGYKAFYAYSGTVTAQRFGAHLGNTLSSDWVYSFTSAGSNTTASDTIALHGIFTLAITVSTSGNLSFQWGANTSGQTATLYAGSNLVLHRVS